VTVANWHLPTSMLRGMSELSRSSLPSTIRTPPNQEKCCPTPIGKDFSKYLIFLEQFRSAVALNGPAWSCINHGPGELVPGPMKSDLHRSDRDLEH
jgi:hypothetical protein